MGNETFDPQARKISSVLSSRWYFGRNTDGNITFKFENITSKEQCLFECLVVNSTYCKQVVWNSDDLICYLKGTIPTKFSYVSWNTYSWVLPPLSTDITGTFGRTPSCIDVDKYDGMKVCPYFSAS